MDLNTNEAYRAKKTNLISKVGNLFSGFKRNWNKPKLFKSTFNYRGSWFCIQLLLPMYHLFQRKAINKERAVARSALMCHLCSGRTIMKRVSGRFLSSGWNHHLTVLVRLHPDLLLWVKRLVNRKPLKPKRAAARRRVRELLSLTRNCFLLFGYPSRIALTMSEAWEKHTQV